MHNVLFFYLLYLLYLHCSMRYYTVLYSVEYTDYNPTADHKLVINNQHRCLLTCHFC